jgi:hypothetical protein
MAVKHYFVFISWAQEQRARKDHRGVDLISDALPFGRLWYGEPGAINNAIGYAKFFSRSHGGMQPNNPPEVSGSIPYVHFADTRAAFEKALREGAEAMFPPERVMEGLPSPSCEHLLESRSVSLGGLAGPRTAAEGLRAI